MFSYLDFSLFSMICNALLSLFNLLISFFGPYREYLFVLCSIMPITLLLGFYLAMKGVDLDFDLHDN